MYELFLEKLEADLEFYNGRLKNLENSCEPESDMDYGMRVAYEIARDRTENAIHLFKTIW